MSGTGIASVAVLAVSAYAPLGKARYGDSVVWGARSYYGACTTLGSRSQPERLLHCGIQYQNSQFEYNLYQECGFLYLISVCDVRYSDWALCLLCVKSDGVRVMCGNLRAEVGRDTRVKSALWHCWVERSRMRSDGRGCAQMKEGVS
eukprot:2416066-Rhodomonas_salina.12